MAPVKGDELIRLIVEAMPRKQLVGMRDRYAREATIVECGARRVGPNFVAVKPIMIKRYDDPCGQLW